jgi:hypothetical protein
VSAGQIQNAVIAALRDAYVRSAAPLQRSQLRWVVAATVGTCTAAELAAAVQVLRYQGKLHWDRLELSASLLVDLNIARAAPETATGPDDDEGEDYPGGVNDAAAEIPVEVAGFVPKALLHKAGVHGAQTRAAARPVPAPEHEPEIARLVREDATVATQRRRQARSTGTVRQPIELRKYGVPDMSMSEVIGSMLSDDPKMIMRAVSRKHPAMWRRCILLGRATAKSPMQALYAALETGLEQLETQREMRDVA